MKSKLRSEYSISQTECVLLSTHEICSPLTAIKGYVSLVREGSYGKISKDAEKILRLVEDSANKLVTRVHDALLNDTFM